MKKILIYTIFIFISFYSLYYYFFKRDIIYTNDICHIIDRRPLWNSDLNDIEEEYNISKFIILSFINQESSFKSEAKPPFKKIFGFIPTWNRLSSSYGYSQAINATWDLYKKQNNKQDAQRNNFYDSAEFVAWYILKSNSINNISTNDTFNLYLSYHEGWSGFNNKSYSNNKKLLNIAKKVKEQEKKYKKDFDNC